MTTQTIAGVEIPDSIIAKEATDLIRDTTNELIFHHSRRVFLFGSLQARAMEIKPDPELLYVAALFHDTGLMPTYRKATQRFELDGADEARAFLVRHGIDGESATIAWTAIALHTTPEIPYRMDPVIAATTAGVETDVLGLRLDNLTHSEIQQVTDVHPRPQFKKQILAAFTHGFAHRPDSTFGTVNADVLQHFLPTFHRADFVDIITNSSWPD